MIAYYASAEIGCHLALGWPLPTYVLDLYVEFRNFTNGVPLRCGSGLLGAMAHFGLDVMGSIEKEEMRQLALRGGPWTLEEQQQLLDYCETDVRALDQLLTAMEQHLDVERAVLRGRYMKAAAHIEHTGIPMDMVSLTALRGNWETLKLQLVKKIDWEYGVYEGTTFKSDRWEQFLVDNGIPWPLLPSGRLALSDDTFRRMAGAHPVIEPIRQLRATLAQLRLEGLTIGPDGRNRCMLSALQSRTGRNQPSTKNFIFGAPAWLRGLIRPPAGHGLAYIDWCQQEFGIAAALSGDGAMIEAYASADPYLAFARQAGAAPENATKASHPHVREQFKACALGVLYGMEERSLAARIGQPVASARELLRKHLETYPKFWQWSDAVVDYAMLRGKIWTVFGWTLRVGPNPNPRSLRNFPMQANGAEMLRLACCLTTERGVRVCAPVHDAILIEAPLNQLDAAVAIAQEAMAKASGWVLDGLQLRSGATLIRHPDRFRDERGAQMWATVQEVLAEL